MLVRVYAGNGAIDVSSWERAVSRAAEESYACSELLSSEQSMLFCQVDAPARQRGRSHENGPSLRRNSARDKWEAS